MVKGPTLATHRLSGAFGLVVAICLTMKTAKRVGYKNVDRDVGIPDRDGGGRFLCDKGQYKGIGQEGG